MYVHTLVSVGAEQKLAIAEWGMDKRSRE